MIFLISQTHASCVIASPDILVQYFPVMHKYQEANSNQQVASQLPPSP